MGQIALVPALLIAVISFAFGIWAYRYSLKKNPEKLEQWAKEIKLAGERAKQELDR